MKRPQVILLLLASTAILFVASLGCCFGQTDTNLLASGDWSKPVQDDQGYTLRGRLLVYDQQSFPFHARIYLELQHVFRGDRWDGPVAFYYNLDSGDVLHFDMRDGLNQPVPTFPVSIRGPGLPPYLITMPCDSTIRLRADWYDMGPPTQPDGFEIFVVGGCWLIKHDATNDFYLSASFTPPKDLTSVLNELKYHFWQGTLDLPKVKIPVWKLSTESPHPYPFVSVIRRDDTILATFPSSGIRWVVKQNSEASHISNYKETITLHENDTLLLIEKHSSAKIIPLFSGVSPRLKITISTGPDLGSKTETVLIPTTQK